MAQDRNNIAATKVEARAYPIAEPKTNTVAFAGVTIDDKFAASGLRVKRNKDNELYVEMPQTRDNKGDYRDVCFPVTAELRKQISDTVLDKYAAALDEQIAARASTVDKMRETARSVRERTPDKASDKVPGKGKNEQEV
jgi:stage V sporulation protein G